MYICTQALMLLPCVSREFGMTDYIRLVSVYLSLKDQQLTRI